MIFFLCNIEHYRIAFARYFELGRKKKRSIAAITL
jgi:hypothetical protein